MKLELNPSIGAATQAVSGGAPSGKPAEAAAPPGDGIEISNVFAALDQSARISRIAAAVRDGSYQLPSTATGNALIDDALTGGN